MWLSYDTANYVFKNTDGDSTPGTALKYCPQKLVNLHQLNIEHQGSIRRNLIHFTLLTKSQMNGQASFLTFIPIIPTPAFY